MEFMSTFASHCRDYHLYQKRGAVVGVVASHPERLES